jgi:Family of unknown function (DUF5994)
MLSTTGGQAASSPAPPARPRLRLQPDQFVATLLDGGWCPRSDDPAAELPGLILALDERQRAAQAGNRDHAPAILATISAAARMPVGRAPVPAAGRRSS